MECLAGSDEIHALSGQTGSLSERVYAFEARIVLQQTLSSFAHFPVRFDAVHKISIGKKHLRQESGAGPQVGNHRFRAQAAFIFQQIHDFARIPWAVAQIILDAVGEALGGVHWASVSLAAREASKLQEPT